MLTQKKKEKDQRMTSKEARLAWRQAGGWWVVLEKMVSRAGTCGGEDSKDELGKRKEKGWQASLREKADGEQMASNLASQRPQQSWTGSQRTRQVGSS